MWGVQASVDVAGMAGAVSANGPAAVVHALHRRRRVQKDRARPLMRVGRPVALMPSQHSSPNIVRHAACFLP